MTTFSRRSFLQTTSATLAVGSLSPAIFAGNSSPNEKVVIGVMGTSMHPNGRDGRGTHLAKAFANLPNCEIAYVCDVDKRNLGNAIEKVGAQQSKKPKGVEDFRRILDDQSVDAVLVTTPDHWHAPAAILACQAGKDVYVEKPCSHNPREGEMLLEVARKHQRKVQVGTQRRSRPGIREGIEKLHQGIIGEVLYARCHYYNGRQGIGTAKKQPVPDWLNWDLWQGPAPRVEYQENYLHYFWHWFWHWGTAELGNNGVHYLDVLRWGLNVDFPDSVTSTGGNLRYQDDQETPDTSVSTFRFGKKMVMFEQRSWSKQSAIDGSFPMTFFGEKGSMAIKKDCGYVVYDLNGKEIDSGTGPSGEKNHLENFLASVRGDEKLNCDIEQGHLSTLLCHLANISYRTGQSVNLEPKTHQVIGNPEATKLWTRDYHEEFRPHV